MEEEIGKLSIKMDSNNLFKETVYTDRKSGSIKMLEKIDVETNTVANDEKLFIGETQIMTPMGALPINFEIPAKTINDAVAEFGDSAKIAINKAEFTHDERLVAIASATCPSWLIRRRLVVTLITRHKRAIFTGVLVSNFAKNTGENILIRAKAGSAVE